MVSAVVVVGGALWPSVAREGATTRSIFVAARASFSFEPHWAATKIVV